MRRTWCPVRQGRGSPRVAPRTSCLADGTVSCGRSHVASVTRSVHWPSLSPTGLNPTGLDRPRQYDATLDTAAELYVRMPEPNFGMSALSGSVEIGADDAADVGRRTPTGTRHARTRMARNAAPEVPVPLKISGENLGTSGVNPPRRAPPSRARVGCPSGLTKSGEPRQGLAKGAGQGGWPRGLAKGAEQELVKG